MVAILADIFVTTTGIFFGSYLLDDPGAFFDLVMYLLLQQVEPFLGLDLLQGVQVDTEQLRYFLDYAVVLVELVVLQQCAEGFREILLDGWRGGQVRGVAVDLGEELLSGLLPQLLEPFVDGLATHERPELHIILLVFIITGQTQVVICMPPVSTAVMI